jgi:hypothetical protein
MLLYSKAFTRQDIVRRCGSHKQFFGVRLYEMGDGAARGVRTLEFRTGSGLRFSVLVDRAFDIGDAEFQGANIGWNSPTDVRHPAYHTPNDERGLSWLRSFSGLLMTCGLDHTLFMASESAEHYIYPGRSTIDFPLHGRIANTPGELHGYGESWAGDDCLLWCEGIVTQATVFGENLQLLRRIEARVGESSLTIRDRVINHGFYRTPHMFLYHINVGYPVLDEGSEYVAPIRKVIWAAHAAQLRKQNAGYRIQPGPMASFTEQVYEHAMACDGEGKVPVGLVNRTFGGGRGLGFAIETDVGEFPCHFQWQNFQEGLYAHAIEPSTHHVLGRAGAKERGEMIWLEQGEERRYTTRFTVLEDNEQIERFTARVHAIATQPQENFVAPSGEFAALATRVDQERDSQGTGAPLAPRKSRSAP